MRSRPNSVLLLKGKERARFPAHLFTRANCQLLHQWTFARCFRLTLYPGVRASESDARRLDR